MENFKASASAGAGPESESSLAKKVIRKENPKGRRSRTTFNKLVEWIMAHDYPEDVTEKLIKYARKYPSGSYEVYKKNFSVYVARAQILPQPRKSE